jgi:hypothetical protein
MLYLALEASDVAPECLGTVATEAHNFLSFPCVTGDITERPFMHDSIT